MISSADPCLPGDQERRARECIKEKALGRRSLGLAMWAILLMAAVTLYMP
jgi:hypothetical protein